MNMVKGAILIYVFIAVSVMQFSLAQTVDEVMGRIEPLEEYGFIRIPTRYTTQKTPVYAKERLYKAFVRMHEAAARDGVDIRITSARRSFDEQVSVFRTYGYVRALPPGTSSHHYGNAIDIANGAYGRLQQHASVYGFCQTYDGTSSAQEAESRHYEYYPEEFRTLLINYRDDIYATLLREQLIPTSGDGVLTKQELFEKYVYPISHSCIDAYPSRIDDVITGIRFDRKLDSKTPEQLVYTISRYKFPAGTGLLDLLPPEIRFLKDGTDIVRFASLEKYPPTIQSFLIDYDAWFRNGLERFVLLRVYDRLRASNPSMTLIKK